MTTLELVNNDGDDANGEQWELPQVQISDNRTVGQPDSFNPPGASSDQNFISQLKEEESFELTGLVTAPGLSGKSSPNSYSSDWRTALAEFAARGEEFCNSAQFTGYELKERDRDRTSGLNVVIRSFQWTYVAGAINELSYTLELERGEGLLPSTSLSVSSPSPGSTDSVPTLAPNDVNRDLKGFKRLRMRKSLDLSVNARAFGGAGENDITASQGAVRRWTYQGEYAGTATERNSFDDDLRSLVQNDTFDFQTVFPGYTAQVAVVEFNSTREAQHGANKHDYELVLQEGQ